MKFIKQLFILGCLTISFLVISDIISKFSRGLHFNFFRYTLIAKTVLLIIYAFFFIVNSKEYLSQKVTKNLILVILGLSLTFFLTNVFPFNYVPFDYNNGEFLIRYLFFPITFLIFYKLFQDKEKTSKLFKLYEWIFLFNFILILIGFLFELELLKSYTNPHRFGYSGIYMRTNQASYIFILFIAIYYYKINHLKERNKLKLFFTILMALLIGTKRIYFFLIILLCFHIYKSRKKINRIHVLLSGALVALGFLFKEQIIQVFKSKFSIFIELYHDKGLLASVTSYRDETLLNTLNYEVYPNWSFVNVLFGGTNFTNYRPELDIVDVFLFFGLSGLVIYLFFIKVFLKEINITNSFLSFFFILILLISFTSSGFFNSVNIPFIFLLGIFFLKHLITKEQDLK